MFISNLAINRPIVTITVMLALVVFGAFALFSLKTDEFPEIQQPVIGISIVYPGASPETVEREVVDRVEEAVFGISGVDMSQSTSTSTDGLAQLVVTFEYEKDIQQASQDIRDAISGIRDELPPEIEEPVLTRFDPSELPIFSLTLTSTTLPISQLTQLADPTLSRQLRAEPGVAEVRIAGGVEREMTVELRPAALQAAGVGVAQVVQALEAQNLAAPVGRLNVPLSETTLRLQGRLQTPEGFAQVSVAERNGETIRLGQVARVVDGAEEPRTLALFNGIPAVGIDIIKSRGYSTSDVSDRIKERVAEMRKTLPQGVTLEVVVDAGTRVKRAVGNVQTALWEGALLTILVVFVFLNSWRSTVITGLALPISVLAAFIGVWIFGFTLNTMSLLGLSLAIGILIDDAIVVRENIVRHIQMGRDHRRAAYEATNEIGLAVAATTFSIVAVFVPVAFMSGISGQWFKPFALTIACAVLVSLLVSFSLDPMLSAYWYDPQVVNGGKRNVVTRALDRFNAWFERQADRYKGVIAWALDHRLAMVLLAIAAFVGAIVLQGTVGGAGFVPESDESEINMVVESPAGASLEYTRLKSEEVARAVRAHPEVAYTYTTIGTPIPLRAPGVDQALIYVRLLPKKERNIQEDVLAAKLREELARIGGATVSVFSGGFGGAFNDIQIELRGNDARKLDAWAAQVMAEVKKVPGAVDVSLSARPPKPELSIEIDRALAGMLGITVADVAQALRPAFAGIDSGDWVDPTGETRDVMVRFAPESRRRATDLAQLPLVMGPASGTAPMIVPLGQIARLHESKAPAQINHLGRDRVVNVQANLQDRPLNAVMDDILRRTATVPTPPGFRMTQGGQTRDQQEVFVQIFSALALAVLLMYLILVIQFGSFVDPLAILVSLPLSLIGVVVALIVTGDTLNIMSLIGVMLLMGIVAKNAILLIDFAKWSRQRGMPLREALIEAGRIRLRPILMTTFALIAGMIPVALGEGEGADFRAPLGRAVIGGTITSTLLTLLVIPTVYEILDGWREGLKRRLGRLTRGSQVPVRE